MRLICMFTGHLWARTSTRSDGRRQACRRCGQPRWGAVA